MDKVIRKEAAPVAAEEAHISPEERSEVQPTPFFQAIAAIARKDLAAEFRSRELFSTMMVFSLLVIVIFNFALELDIPTRRSVTAGVLWVTFAFAGTLGLNRSLSAEREQGCIDGLLLAPVDRSAIYFGKAISNLVFMTVVEVIVLPIYAFLYNVNLLNGGLLAIIFLGSIGYTAVGTLLATMSVQTRTREVLLPILLFPIVLPILIAAVRASGAVLAGDDFSAILPWLNFVLVYDVIFIAIAFMVFDFIVQD